jgi:hypothetical protein
MSWWTKSAIWVPNGPNRFSRYRGFLHHTVFGEVDVDWRDVLFPSTWFQNLQAKVMGEKTCLETYINLSTCSNLTRNHGEWDSSPKRARPIHESIVAYCSQQGVALWTAASRSVPWSLCSLVDVDSTMGLPMKWCTMVHPKMAMLEQWWNGIGTGLRHYFVAQRDVGSGSRSFSIHSGSILDPRLVWWLWCAVRMKPNGRGSVLSPRVLAGHGWVGPTVSLQAIRSIPNDGGMNINDLCFDYGT